MKHKDLTDFRNKTIPELEALITKIKAEIIKSKMDLANHRSKDTNGVSKLKRNLAQILTIKTELLKLVK